MDEIDIAIKPQSLLTLDTPSSDGPYREWYFAFSESTEDLPWWQRLALMGDPEHIRHTYAFTQMGDYVLFVEPHRTKIDFVLKYPDEDFPKMCANTMAQELVSHGHIVVKHVYIPNIRGVKSIWNFIPSCVSVVKVATGYNSLARSPKQLLHCLIKNGANLIFAEEV